MANDLDLRVRLLGDSSDLEAATQDAEQSVDRLGTVMAGLGVAGAAGGAALSVGFARAADLEEGQAKLQAQLGLTAEQAGEFGGLAGDVYASNFGDSMGTVNDALVAVTRNLGAFDESEEGLKANTEAALTLSDALGLDVAASTEAAAALLRNGLAKDGAEAFDMIAASIQSGTNKADDLLDTITEYSPQFAKFGFTGAETMALFEAGINAGARDTDVLADSFKEFNLQVLDMGSNADAGFKALGINAAEGRKAIASGGPAAKKMTQEVLAGLAAIKDPQKQNNAGVALFGTTWEDTMRQVVPAMAEAQTWTKDTAGTVDEMTAAMGSTGKARVEEFRRSIEQWITTTAQGTGASSTAVAAIGSFGPAALGAAGSLGAMVSGLASLNLGSAVAATPGMPRTLRTTSSLMLEDSAYGPCVSFCTTHRSARLLLSSACASSTMPRYTPAIVSVTPISSPRPSPVSTYLLQPCRMSRPARLITSRLPRAPAVPPR